VNIVTADFFTLGFSEYASVMVPVNIASIAATLVMLHLFSAGTSRSPMTWRS
jgi:arsenical pump membrane protein